MVAPSPDTLWCASSSGSDCSHAASKSQYLMSGGSVIFCAVFSILSPWLVAVIVCSATGAGQFQTIGKLVTFYGNPLLITPTADMDIFTNADGSNFILGITGRTLFYLPVANIPALALGQTQNVTVQTDNLSEGGLIDIAVSTTARRNCGND